MCLSNLCIGLGLLALCTWQSACAQPSEKLSLGEHDAALGEVTLHYVVAGHGAPVLVPSPNWGPGSLYLQRGLRSLEANHLLVFMDSRGSGKSSRPLDEHRMSLDDMADDMEHLRVYLGIQKLDLIGHSAAGMAAIEYAEQYEGHLGRLVLVDANTYGDSADDRAENKQHDEDMARLAQDGRYTDALKHQRNDPFLPPDDAALMKRLQDTGALAFAEPAKGGPIFAKSIEGMVPSAFAWRTSAAADRAKPLDQKRKLGLVHAAVLVVHGKQDWLVPVLTAQHVHADVAGSKLLIIEDCGHFPWIEQPDAFFSAVDDFFSAPI